ncbi:integral membrane sensor signal transduction histidine kinase [Dinoroseobacter shibae DFL 12 = DSM 16493]|jgi:signal transduction histidine kinase|uniref:histidine kinase n=1 Tax=Dinoroseobacter shibae (strain DSM 16493 / NCIMB 14021 / DFL 12) TaxID=398580 RepID=A8LSN3_DINSH|nr:ATP-binding protein [Dinoroseobacter shibae]ABV94232.1 integral membrane sensor signal transduction histidine kinase [Dinoroseobacter shibae DFL 12 = DSM 16493]URF45673.1 ATP-binding protein [Dinoroseobacter shibae]URF49978.1 ATP-binding protein [Dinoroseobacter shibae]
MTMRRARLLPDTLAGRFVLLLATAILAANLIGLVVLGLQQQRFDRQTLDDRWIARIAALIPVLETVDADTRQVLTQQVSNRLARFRVGQTPLVARTGRDSRSASLAAGLAETLGRTDLRVALIDRPASRPAPERTPGARAGRIIAVSVPLSPREGEAAWLNVTTGGGPPRPSPVDSRPFLTFLALSLLSVLAVGIVFARRLARPLGRLSDAAQAAGRGDRDARVPEEGPREMRAAARAFNAMQTEISRFDAERMRMIAAIGHDLRTPMTSLRIRAEMVDDAKQREAMVRTLDEMTVMADGLVSYARHGQDSEAMQAVDLGGLLSKLCAERGAEYDGISEVQVMGRPIGLGRAIGNLIDNALRYGEAARVTLARQDGHAIVTVDDTGPGIAPERMDEMFQPFRRGDHSRSAETGGVGLGLSIARTIVLAHGGILTLENRTEGGLRATVRLQAIT